VIQTPDCPNHRLHYLGSKKERRGRGMEKKASPHTTYEGHIMLPEQLHMWAAAKCYSLAFLYCTAEDYGKEMVMLYYTYS